MSQIGCDNAGICGRNSWSARSRRYRLPHHQIWIWRRIDLWLPNATNDENHGLTVLCVHTSSNQEWVQILSISGPHKRNWNKNDNSISRGQADSLLCYDTWLTKKKDHSVTSDWKARILLFTTNPPFSIWWAKRKVHSLPRQKAQGSHSAVGTKKPTRTPCQPGKFNCRSLFVANITTAALEGEDHFHIAAAPFRAQVKQRDARGPSSCWSLSPRNTGP